MKPHVRFALIALAALLGCGDKHSNHQDESSIAEVTAAASVAGQYAYQFGSTGLATSVSGGGLSYSITSSGNVLTAGTDTYRFDAIGRVVAVDDLTLTYGPDSQVARATRGAETLSYLYDEDGQRILKKTNGTPVSAYVDGNVVTASEIDEPVRVAGKVIGLLRNATFTLAVTDSRGTVQADTNGTPRLASPFGARPVHPDVAGAIDYAEKEFDADIGATRMGVRDYDARIARFLQPDPAFMDHPEKCVQSPSECNLYGYALGRPIDFVDPKGEGGIAVSFEQGLIPHAGVVLYDDKTGKASWVEFNPGAAQLAWTVPGKVDIRENIGTIEKGADGTPTVLSLQKLMDDIIQNQSAKGAFAVIVPEADASKALAFAKSQVASPPRYNALAAAPGAENCATFAGAVLRAGGAPDARGVLPVTLTGNLMETHSSFTQHGSTITGGINPPMPNDLAWHNHEAQYL